MRVNSEEAFMPLTIPPLAPLISLPCDTFTYNPAGRTIPKPPLYTTLLPNPKPPSPAPDNLLPSGQSEQLLLQTDAAAECRTTQIRKTLAENLNWSHQRSWCYLFSIYSELLRAKVGCRYKRCRCLGRVWSVELFHSGGWGLFHSVECGAIPPTPPPQLGHVIALPRFAQPL